MRVSAALILIVTFFAAAVACFVAAGFAVTAIEDKSEISVRRALDLAAMDWAEVEADGLQVFLTGTAPTEAKRFNALSTAGGVVDAARVIDKMDVAASAILAPPRFSIEILRNHSGISLIGLIPVETGRDDLLATVGDISDGANISDFLGAANYPTPDGWNEALLFAVSALEILPRSKISISADQVAITAISDSVEAKHRLEAEITRAAPAALRLTLDISAPRPVITPFALRFVIDQNGARFEGCAADTIIAKNRIARAATAAGFLGDVDCTLALGTPSPNWATAAEKSIAALANIGAGSLTFSDADITLIAAVGTPQDIFDRIIGELENTLPDVFALHATLPNPVDTATREPPEFVATLSPEGAVQLRGRLRNDITRDAVNSMAQARFGSDRVYLAARLDENLPDNWPIRVLSGIEALAHLSNGAVTITPDTVQIIGKTGEMDSSARIARLLAEKLGDSAQFSIDVAYVEKLDPVAGLPTPDECETEIAEILTSRKIAFEPGSGTIDSAASGIMDDIAEVLKLCGEIKLEIGGHTDSQGREIMNQQLSQARAQAVLDELRARRVLTSSYRAVGFGETQPIADNKTEAGREANRRIEFVLIRPKPVVEEPTGLEALTQDIAAQPASNPDSSQQTTPETATAQEGTHDEQN
ncbi:MAG: OmpA family protein [Rhodobacterales bacterium]|nr:OmpA family protein [Rhodobacterales bacterium]